VADGQEEFGIIAAPMCWLTACYIVKFPFIFDKFLKIKIIYLYLAS